MGKISGSGIRIRDEQHIVCGGRGASGFSCDLKARHGGLRIKILHLLRKKKIVQP
jgi:hypothetical protein